MDVVSCVLCYQGVPSVTLLVYFYNCCTNVFISGSFTFKVIMVCYNTAVGTFWGRTEKDQSVVAPCTWGVPTSLTITLVHLKILSSHLIMHFISCLRMFK